MDPCLKANLGGGSQIRMQYPDRIVSEGYSDIPDQNQQGHVRTLLAGTGPAKEETGGDRAVGKGQEQVPALHGRLICVRIYPAGYINTELSKSECHGC